MAASFANMPLLAIELMLAKTVRRFRSFGGLDFKNKSGGERSELTVFYGPSHTLRAVL